MMMTTRARRPWRWTVALLLVMLSAAPAVGRDLSVVGGDRHTWVVRPAKDGKAIEVLHRLVAEPAAELRYAGQFNGRLAPHGAAASGNNLWLVYADRTIARLSAQEPEARRPWRFEQNIEPPLPKAELRDAIATRDELWALIAVTDPATRRELTPTTQPATQRTAATQPADADGEAGSTQPDGLSAQAGTATRPMAVGVDRLVVLRQGDWRAVALPEGWSSGMDAWLVADPSSSLRPRLLARPPGDPETLKVYRWDGEHWRHTAYRLPSADRLVPTAVQQQLVVARRMASEGPIRLALHWLRDGKMGHVGEFTVPGTAPEAAWTALARELGVAIWAQRPADAEEGGADSGSGEARGDAQQRGKPNGDDPGDGGLFNWLPSSGGQASQPTGPVDLVSAVFGLSGDQLRAPVQMRIAPQPTRQRAYETVLVAVLMIALVLMLGFWRRPSATAAVELPKGMNVAAVGKRALAGALDLAPALVIAMAAFNIGPVQLLTRWPGQPPADAWPEMIPGAIAILLLVLHTCVAEAVWGRSLGKALIGLRVVDVQGQRPRVWQLLVRNGLKTLDLIVFFLLALAILPPRHQRLGDLVAGTMVVEKAEAESSQQADDES